MFPKKDENWWVAVRLMTLKVWFRQVKLEKARFWIDNLTKLWAFIFIYDSDNLLPTSNLPTTLLVIYHCWFKNLLLEAKWVLLVHKICILGAREPLLKTSQSAAFAPFQQWTICIILNHKIICKKSCFHIYSYRSSDCLTLRSQAWYENGGVSL